MKRQSSRRCCHGNALLIFLSKLPLLLLAIQLVPQYQVLPNNLNFGVVTVAADGLLTNLASQLNDRLFPPEDYINDGVDLETKSLNIIQISEMRARDIKRRLAREHGYGADELSRMLDKKELINTLSYEEHKVYQQETDKRKWRRIKSTIIYTCAAVLVVMFWPLLSHAFEVAHVNFVVYTDKRRHELSRCREYSSSKGYFGMFLLFIIDGLSTWLSVSVLLSWVMKSKYFFPIPNIPIRPAQLLAGGLGGDAGALGQYGINVGPMIISGLFRFLNNRVEGMIGNAMASAFQRQRKNARKEERAKEKEERRKMKKEAKLRMKEEEERARQEAEERARVMEQNDTAAASNCKTDDSDLGSGNNFSSSPFDDLD
mmetsp:Transcript_23070/g.34941  ORF Transcript_23070/g.34941 Transcript_23070/m.34941 type:complete len:372 (-) Transcript_23070:59-1174(-)|eukprot:scaffold2041_cov102-Skeletonema_dohrnii-CCMP3373.AAC.9